MKHCPQTMLSEADCSEDSTLTDLQLAVCTVQCNDFWTVRADSGSIQKSRSKDRREKSTGGAEGQPAATVHKAKAKVEPKASDEQARGAVRKRPNKRPNKRIPANVDDLDKALSKRARQLFSSGISM